MSQLVEELVKSGQNKNLMSTTIPRWESTTTAGTLLGIQKESGATPLIQIRNGSTALSHSVLQHMIVKKVIHLVAHIEEF